MSKKIQSKPVKGFIFDGYQMKPTVFFVNYTSDKLGKTLSIDDTKTQYTIPFDEIYKLIKED